MYGTIARMKLKPGVKDAFLKWTASTVTARSIPGLLQMTVYQMDSDPDVLMMAVAFESRDAYVSNAASSEQHAEFLMMMEYLTAEPEWHDGEILFYLPGSGRSKKLK